MTTRKASSSEVPPRSPGKRISEEDASVRHRYRSIRVLRDGRVRFSPKTIPGIPELDFSAVYAFGLADGTYVEDRSSYAVDARWPGNDTFFVLWITRHRVRSACFNFTLSPNEMRRAVALLRKAGGGIERWIVPGLEYTRDEFARAPTRDDRGPKMLAVIQELLEANRDLPVAEQWKRQRPGKRPRGLRGAPRAASARRRGRAAPPGRRSS